MKPRSALSLITFIQILALHISTVVYPSNLFAQIDNNQNNDRMDRTERQGFRGGSNSMGDNEIQPANAAQIGVQLSDIEEQLRQLRGKTEENENQLRKLSDSLTKMQRDTDFRLNELAHATPPAAATAPTPIAPAANPPPADKASAAPQEKIATKSDTPTTAGDGILHPPEKGAKESSDSFSNPRDHYNYAFRLLNQTQYEEAASAFDSFTKKYPKDPLVGNAFYWEGETYYIRRDYVNAADNFRQGFEKLPEGPKAADNLLKLAMSLNAMSKDKEACLILQQITSKFKKSASSVSDKADSEQKRIGCHKS